MDVVEGLFDGEGIILKDNLRIPLIDIKRARIELHPYLVFSVKLEQEDGSFEEDEAAILYPHTIDRELDKGALVYGEKRPTRICHYVPYGDHRIIRKPDLRHPHTVKMLGYRELIIEQVDGSETRVNFDGNCYHIPLGVRTFFNGQEEVPLEEFFDRPSELVNIIKKAGIEVYFK